MGRRDKSYYRDLKQQVHDRFDKMAAYGQSKKDAIAHDTDRNKIHSHDTYKTYRKHSIYFVNYIKEHHPECTSLNQARKYIGEWIEVRKDYIQKDGTHLSAWTLSTEAASLRKLYGITPDQKDYPRVPQRKREDIKRSRGDAVRDRHFSEKNNDEFVKFCRGTGCRRQIVEKLKGGDLALRSDMEQKFDSLKSIPEDKRTPAEKKEFTALKDALETFPDQKAFLHHRTDKGGRDRYAPIIGPSFEQIVERLKEKGMGESVWQVVPSNADIHSYRADYATNLYRMYARPIEEIPYDKFNEGTGKKYQSEVYTCRKDEKGKKLDKRAMMKVSKALGHNRLEIVANNYLRGL